MLKRFFTIITISLIITGSFFSVYRSEYPVYADSTTDQWTQVTTNAQLVEAFKYYCKSRDLTIEGSVADAVTSFTTKTFNGICNTLGIDVTALQAQIKYQTDDNLGLKFLFSATAINAYNRIFAQFLQDNDLSVGDSLNDEQLYYGEWFVDADGNGCLVYVFDNMSTSAWLSTANFNNKLVYEGSYYKYSGESLYNYGKTITSGNLSFFTIQQNLTTSLTVNENVGLFENYYQNTNGFGYVYSTGVNSNTSQNSSLLTGTLYGNFDANGNYTDFDRSGGYIIYKDINSTSLSYGLITIQNNLNSGNEDKNYYITFRRNISGGSATNVNIYINSPTINNNTYEGDTVINNNGDTNNYYPDTPDIPDPNPDTTPDPPTLPDEGGWQDFTLPEMPNDWLIYGMEKKFPFDIPFNILFGLSLLNHEPEIPQFEGDIDLKVCTWHYDIDLTPFDDIAKILRKFEVLAFIIGLAMITKELIMWG